MPYWRTGVGKRVIVAGVAQRIVNATVPKKLQGNKIFSINWENLVAGTKLPTEIEQRLRLAVDEAKQSHGAAIFFINQWHNFIGISTKTNVANI
ncbi:hypothetical protein ACH5RR_032710 [Cinchona calisaya]|uniref:Uncharacterized protein n=1 Tax=Cinchona calisaya TaxID=153742 RepID=A0ABD2YIW6_9GENT